MTRVARMTTTFLGTVTILATLTSVKSSAQHRGLFYQTVVTSSTPGAHALANPTALAIHPDGRLFIAQLNGMIHAVTVDANLNVVGSAMRIDTVHFLGSSPGRVVTGLAFSPSDGHLYVSHSDGRLNDPGILQFSGRVGRLLAPSFTTYQDVVTNLPRSQRDHGPNGLAFSGGYLYLAQAGMTNAGTPYPAGFWNFPETLDSGAILKIDPNAVNSYTRYATGFRNPYKPLFHTNGGMYTNDNGPNLNSGTRPIGGSNCGPHPTDTPLSGDELNLVHEGHYYGHPNPARAQCDHNPPGGHINPIHSYGTNTSANGLAEYPGGSPGNAFMAMLPGHIFTANYATGMVVSLNMSGFNPFGNGPARRGLANPLDVAISPAGHVFIAEFGSHTISALRPRSMMPVDFDADRRSDLTIYRPSTHTFWSYSPGANTMTPVVSGSPGVIPRPADIDGDSKVDAVTWHPTTGLWTLPHSAWGFVVTVTHGSPGDIALSADVEGDGRADQIIFRPSNGTWYVRYTNTGVVIGYPWGGNGDIPRIMDVDGDGRADLVVYRPSTGVWHILPFGSFWDPYNPATGFFRQWGGSGDLPVPADFDGDGKTDIAVWRLSTGQWFVLPNAGGFNQANHFVVQWGGSGDSPRPLDWDGDGRADLCVWRPSNGIWSILLSSTGYNPAFQVQHRHGDPTDIAVDPVF